MKSKRCLTAAVFLAACMMAPVVCAQGDPHHRIVTPGDLEWRDLGSLPAGAKVAIIEGDPNREGMVTMRVKLPPNYRIAPHYHGTVERSTIVSGTLNIGVGEKFDMGRTTALPPGSMLLMPPKMPHFAWTKEEVIFQLNVMGPWTVTYLNAADDPRKQ
jgi:quercetin dioxygenase-like cupin family protein